MTSQRYVIHCARMKNTEEVIVNGLHELFEWIERYCARYGPIDLLYRVS